MSGPQVPAKVDSPAPAVGGVGSGAAVWHLLILVRITNHPLLRRHLGRAHGDAAPSALAALIDEHIPSACSVPVARDTVEVALISDAAGGLDKAMAAIEAAAAAGLTIGGECHAVELLLGGAAAPEPQHDPVRLVEEAEQALADARGEHRPIARLVSAGAELFDRVTLSRDLRRAIEGDELFVHYQPKLHVRRQTVAAVEALIRWRHPTQGLVLPGDFIPAAEASNDILALTLWTIRRCIDDQRILAARGHDLPVFINIAGVLLADPRFVETACALVADSPARIGFEITETSVIRDPDTAIANLKIFADMGIRISIDDYGAGLSSLAYLKRLPACELKIDKLFVTQLTSSHRDPLIVRSTIDLAHALEMEVVAEGVETPAALALLSVMGCDMVQGYLISRPVALPELITFLADGVPAAIPHDGRALLGRLSRIGQAGR